MGALAAASPPLVMLGRISYGFYLWHVPLLYLLGLDVTRIVQIPVALVGSVMIATLSFHLVERPLQRRFRAAFLPVDHTALPIFRRNRH